MNLAGLLASQFFPAYGGDAKGLSQLGGKTTPLFASAKSVRQFCRPEIVPLSRDLGMPSLLKLLWLKIDTRSQTRQVH